MTTQATLTAPAKINLTLHIVGQRDDGYHLLDSIVAFAESGDEIQVEKALHRACGDHQLAISGPFSKGLEAGADNLVLKAARLFGDKLPALDIKLVKKLPVASGIGGGSADAAATIKAISKLYDLPPPSADQVLSLGADVPVCMNEKAVRMTGIGEEITGLPALPKLSIVLINPLVGVSTLAIFKALQDKNNEPLHAYPAEGWSDASDFINWIKAGRNDLENTAIELCRKIDICLAALASLEGIQLHRMSGSGATCFGLFRTREEADKAAADLKAQHPDWWVMASALT